MIRFYIALPFLYLAYLFVLIALGIYYVASKIGGRVFDEAFDDPLGSFV